MIMSRRSRFAAFAAVMSSSLLMIAGCSSSSQSADSASGSGKSGWPTTLTIGSIPSENATQLQDSLAPIEKTIEAKLGVKVQTFAGTSYAALIEAQKAGKVDLVEYGPLSYYIAQNQNVGVEDVGILVNSATDDGSYYSIAYANSGQTGVTSLADFKGKTTCFVDPASTSGYLYPTYGLEKAGLNPATDVKAVFAGAHDASVESIAKGTCQVGFAESTMLPQLEKEGLVKASQLRQIWQSPKIPGSPIAVSTSLPASFRSALENVLDQDANAPAMAKAGYCSSESACATLLGFWGFANPKVADYSVIAQVCGETKLDSCTKP